MEQSQFENVKNAEESALVSHWACLKSHVMFEDRRICDKIAKSPANRRKNMSHVEMTCSIF